MNTNIQTAGLRELDAATAAGLLEIGATVVDLRDAIPFGVRHLAGSVHIKVKSPDFAARILQFTPGMPPLLLVADSKADADWANIKIAGRRAITGYICGVQVFEGFDLSYSRLPALTPEDLLERVNVNEETFVLDVREIDELETGFIAGSHHIPMNDVLDRISELPRSTPIAITCAGGQRSSLIASRLMTYGFGQLFNVTGGMKAWIAASLPVERTYPTEAEAQ